MNVSLLKRRKTRRSFAAVLATLLVTSVFGDVSKLGAAREGLCRGKSR